MLTRRYLDRRLLAPDRTRIIYTAGPLDMGGAERVALELMCHLDTRAYQVVMIVAAAESTPPRFSDTVRRARERGMLVIEKPRRQLTPSSWRRSGVVAQAMTALPLAVVLLWESAVEFALYRAIRPGIIHQHKVLGLAPFAKRLLARAARIPILVTTYHQFPVSHRRARSEPVRGLVDRVTTWALDALTWLGIRYLDDALVATSPEEKAAHAATGVPAGKIAVISNGIDLTPYRDPPAATARLELRRSLGIPGDAFVFGHIGRLNVQKAQGYQVAAAAVVFREFPGAWLVIAGEGPDREALEAQRAAIADPDLRRRILLVGAIRDTDSAAYHFMFDAFLLSSRFEGQGLVNMEAMAAGRPVIATRVGGVASTLGDEAAILVSPEDAVALEEPMRCLLRDPERCRRMGEAGRARAFARYPVERSARAHEALYDALLEPRVPA